MNNKNNALRNDILIQDLAIYEVSKGNTKTLHESDLKTIQDRFAEYKSLIRRGEFTYDELADRIFTKWGITQPMIQPAPVPIVKEAVNKAVDDVLKQETELFLDTIQGMLNKDIKASQKPYKWYQKIWDKIRLTCSHFYPII